MTVVSVSLCAAELQKGFLSVGSVTLHATETPGGLQKLVPSCPVYRGTTEVPSSCGVFRGADKLEISYSFALMQQICWDASGYGVSCPTALIIVDLLGWLMIWYLQGSRLASSLPQ